RHYQFMHYQFMLCGPHTIITTATTTIMAMMTAIKKKNGLILVFSLTHLKFSPKNMVREVYNHHLLRQTAKFYQNSKTKNSKIVQKMIFFFNKKFMKSCDFKNFFNLFYYQLQLSITLLGIFL